MKATAKQTKPKGQKKANGGGKINIRQATSSLKSYNPSNANGGPVRSVPAAMGSMKITGRPRISGRANGDCSIVHREYLGEVTMAAAFAVKTYTINPGLANSFPWLSTVARRFESYRFRKLKYCYETECSSTQTGSVLLVPDYDVLDAAPTSKVQGLAYRSAARAQAWMSFCQESLQEDLNKQKSFFVRAGTIPANADGRLYDVGNLFLCVQGSDTNVVGEIWVEYEVDLMTPAFADSADGATITGGGSFAGPALFGTAPVTVGSLVIVDSGDTVTFNQAWNGYVTIVYSGTVLTVMTGSGTAVVTEFGDVVNSAGTSGMATYVVRALPGQTAIFTPSATTITSSLTLLGQA